MPTESRVALRHAAVPWVASALISAVAFGLARYVNSSGGTGYYEGAFGWDADWYRRIASVGYGSLPAEGLRFFPGYPLLARVLTYLPGVGTGLALVAVSLAAALIYLALLYRLAVHEELGERAARNTVWAAALAPAAFIYVMGYAEALAGCLLVGVALCARRGWWWPAALLGLAAGVTRPTAVLIGAFVLVEAAHGFLGAGWRDRAARLSAVAAPPLAAAVYLAWCHVRFGDALLPIRVQTVGRLRGGTLVNPLAGESFRIIPQLPWVALSVLLVIVAARRLPSSYTLYAAVTVAAACNANGFISFERVAGSAFPLLLAAGSVIRDGWGRGVALAAGGLMALYAIAAALHLFVP